MRNILATVFMVLSATGAVALDSVTEPGKVVVTPLLSTTETSAGQPIVLPQKDVQLVASIFDVGPGATLPVHKHPSARYGYVLAGTLQVTDIETGKVSTFTAGDFIVEMIGKWHQGANVGAEPVKLLVIDQMEEGQPATVLRE